MNQTTLRSPYEHLVGEDHDLGDGLSEAELYFWAERKRAQNFPHFEQNHTFCGWCKNCLCNRPLSPNFGFRCVCDSGKSMLTPYRIRFRSASDRDHHNAREIYCLNHHVYEPHDLHAD